MSQSAIQRRIWATLSAGLGAAAILSLFLHSSGAIGFPDLFLIGSSSVIQGIAIGSTLIFIAASGFLITTQPQPVRIALVMGAIVALAGAIAVGVSFIAPGILPAITAGIIYTLAWMLVAATCSRISTGLTQRIDNKGSSLPKPVIWLIPGFLGFLWLANTLFRSYGLIATPWLFLATAIPVSIWFACEFIAQKLSQALNGSQSYTLELALSASCLWISVVIYSGSALSDRGALIWILDIIIMTFAVIAALVLNFCIIQFPDIHSRQVAIRNTFPFRNPRVFLLLCTMMLIGIVVSGLWGYSDYFWGGVSLSERLESLSSATFFDKILDTQLQNRTITISADDRFLANGGKQPTLNGEKIVQLWDLETGKLTRTFPGYSDPFITGSHSSQFVLLMRTPNGQVEEWNLTNYQHQPGNDHDKKLLEERQAQRHQTVLPSFLPRYAVFLASSTDGKTLATGFEKQPMRDRILLWNTSTGRLLYSLSPGSYYSAIAFSPSGHLLANDPSGMTNTGDIHLWRLSKR